MPNDRVRTVHMCPPCRPISVPFLFCASGKEFKRQRLYSPCQRHHHQDQWPIDPTPGQKVTLASLLIITQDMQTCRYLPDFLPLSLRSVWLWQKIENLSHLSDPCNSLPTPSLITAHVMHGRCSAIRNTHTYKNASSAARHSLVLISELILLYWSFCAIVFLITKRMLCCEVQCAFVSRNPDTFVLLTFGGWSHKWWWWWQWWWRWWWWRSWSWGSVVSLGDEDLSIWPDKR